MSDLSSTDHAFKQTGQEGEPSFHVALLEALDRVNQVILHEEDLEMMLRRALESVLKIFDCDRAWLLYPCDPASATWRVPMECTRPEYPGAHALGVEFSTTEEMATIFQETLRMPGPVVFDQITKKPLPKFVMQQYSVQAQIQMAIYPRNDKPWVFGLHQCSYARVWTDGEIRLFQQVGARLADGLNLYLLNQTLRASETRYRSVVEDLTEFVMRWHPSGTRTFVNEAFCRFLNQPAEALLGREAIDTVDAQIRAEIGNWTTRLAVRRPTFSVEQELSRPGGEQRWIEWSLRGIFTNSNVLREVQTVGRDVTGQRQTEAQLRERETQLAHVSRLSTMGELVAGIAHEVNQPLFSIQNYAQASGNVLENKDPDRELLKQWNRDIANAAQRAGKIIRRLAQFVRPQEPVREKVPIAEVVGESIDLMSFEIKRKQVTIELVPAESPLPVFIDRVQIEQVLVNLLQNAMEAMAEQAPPERRITLCIEPTDDEVEVVVRDHGPGLPNGRDASLEYGASLFAPFVSGKKTGMGMGLAISNTIIQAHGGRLWATPALPRGAKFHFSLPRS
jgi:PAS domain S-box-containing protein